MADHYIDWDTNDAIRIYARHLADGTRPRTGPINPEEKRIARILDTLSLKWSYESYVVPLLDGDFFTPDFHLPEVRVLVESKTHCRPDRPEAKQEAAQDTGHTLVFTNAKQTDGLVAFRVLLATGMGNARAAEMAEAWFGSFQMPVMAYIKKKELKKIAKKVMKRKYLTEEEKVAFDRATLDAWKMRVNKREAKLSVLCPGWSHF